MLGATDTSDNRARVYRGLSRRNQVIAVLRLVVPLFGALVLGILIVQIVMANLASDFGASGIRVARDELVIDLPEYSGVMANGTQYTVTARAASTPIGGQDVVALEDAAIELTRPDGYKMNAQARSAQFTLSEQIVRVEDLMVVTDSRDMHARLYDSTIDWSAQTLIAEDNVHVVFGDGTVLTGARMRYDATLDIWDFVLAKLTIPAEEEAD